MLGFEIVTNSGLAEGARDEIAPDEQLLDHFAAGAAVTPVMNHVCRVMIAPFKPTSERRARA